MSWIVDVRIDGELVFSLDSEDKALLTSGEDISAEVRRALDEAQALMRSGCIPPTGSPEEAPVKETEPDLSAPNTSADR